MTEQSPLERAREDLILVAAGARTVTADLLAKPTDRLETEAAANGRPSRFKATPAEVDVFLRSILAEDTYLRYQQAIGNAAASEAADDARDEAGPDVPVRKRPGMGPVQNGMLHTADHIDPKQNGGPYPSALVDLGGVR